jgi:hypothetical protein
MIYIIKSIFTAAQFIKETIDNVRANKKQCERLSERITAIVNMLKPFTASVVDFKRVELISALNNFLSCVRKCSKLIQKFADATWFARVFKNKEHKETFADLNLHLSQCAIDLNLGINLSQIFDRSNDEKDQQADQIDITSKVRLMAKK